MAARKTFSPSDSEYPARLRALRSPPATLTTSGDLDVTARRIAIVGAREACEPALAYAETLAGLIAARGGVVVSGGADGVDSAAHRGALAAGGRTWIVAATGDAHIFPAANADLFARVEASAGAMIWPFASDTPVHRGRFLARNGVLVALSDVVVVAQAGIPSGALNAAKWARELDRPLWVVTPAPWLTMKEGAFAGSLVELDRGAHALACTDQFLAAIGLATRPGRDADANANGNDANDAGREPPDAGPLSLALTNRPQHVEFISEKAGISLAATTTLLLTLALEDVVVEGPQGFFRRT